MDPWDAVRRIVADKRSGAAGLALDACDALAALDHDRDVLRAARRVLRVHGAMGSLWRVFDAALSGPRALTRLRDRVASETALVAGAAAGWALPRRGARVLTHSASSVVIATLERAGPPRIASIECTASLPGGEGRALAARLRRMGFPARVVPDAGLARACAAAHVVLVGADAITPAAVVNKAGTMPLALTARECGVPVYALTGTSKMAPAWIWNPDRATAYDATPLEVFDAVVTERGPMRTAGLRRAASRITLDERLEAIAR